MTTIAQSFRPSGAPNEIDVRCSARLPGAGPEEGRCQLFAGHDGPHAVMFAHCGTRMVRTWKRSKLSTASAAGSGALQRPWMYGYPRPAWFETESESAG